jgi:hypothetical protein
MGTLPIAHFLASHLLDRRRGSYVSNYPYATAVTASELATTYALVNTPHEWGCQMWVAT